MVTRNPNNLVAFGKGNYGAPVTHYTIDAGGDLTNETNPGEAMDFIVRVIALKGTIIAIGATATDGIFRVAIENSDWTATDLQAAIVALGATVGTNNYSCSSATVAVFAY
jgi:hypothetical protein